MKPGSLLNTLSNEEQSLATVWQWHEFQRSLIGEEKSRVFSAMATGEIRPNLAIF